MTDDGSWDAILALLRELGSRGSISDENREAAEECRQILLALDRGKVPPERARAVRERFIDAWDDIANELQEQHNTALELREFRLDDKGITINAHMGEVVNGS